MAIPGNLLTTAMAVMPKSHAEARNTEPGISKKKSLPEKDRMRISALKHMLNQKEKITKKCLAFAKL
ncbi:hypothetical protein QUF80_02015 [Desulfococcaceae bacterium HSG8]|nr:hypothetical protein [Desulfococcaceae bacterium HSG8]